MKRRDFLGSATQAGLTLRVSSASPSGDSQAETLVSLDGEWSLAVDPANVGRERSWFSAALPEARRVQVPSIIQEHFPGYHGVAWYSRELTVPSHPHPRGRYLLRFWAVDYIADVWVNSTHVGRHEGGETPFTLDITEAVRPKAAARITVRVLNPRNEPIDGVTLNETPHRNKAIPYVPGRSFATGGITESVDLLLTPALRIADLFVRPDCQTGSLRIQATVENTLSGPEKTSLVFSAARTADSEIQASVEFVRTLPRGTSVVETHLDIPNPRLWDIQDPNLYRVTARASANGAADERSVRCGFRDFRVVDGYFRLNGRRLFLRSTHTGNHCPIGQIIAPRQAPDLLRRDMLYAKSSGFNTVRFIAGIAHPYQLDLCDEIGLMVYEECYAGWELADSPKMAERFDLSVREMILRDRNHPSVTIWGLLNETRDGPVYRKAVASLGMVRGLDDTRLVLLASGRWDCQPSIGSVSNPGSKEWEHTWGAEAPGAPPTSTTWNRVAGGYFPGAGDAHVYPGVPQTREVDHFLRTLGHGTKPVFLSEYGIGSLFDAIREARHFEQAGAAPDTEDYVIVRSMADRLIADWTRFGMDGVYPFPADMLRDSQRLMARQRALGFDLIRSNPRICGFNATGILDHGLTGEGFWRFWREWKPGIVDVLEDGWAPVRWCLFADPLHTYTGHPVKLEAVLANDGALRPGEYPAHFRISGPAGVAWERRTTVRVPDVKEPPLAIPVLEEEVRLDGPAGVYTLVADLERGAPMGRRLDFRLSDRAALPRLARRVGVWGIGSRGENWLASHGVTPEQWTGANSLPVVLVGDVSGSATGGQWDQLLGQIRQGSVAVFLQPQAFRKGKDGAGWLPLEKKGRCYEFNDWLYHKECVAKAHPIFEGLQPKGIMDWDYYGQVIPHYLFDGQDTPDDVAAAAFALGYAIPGGYASGVLIGSYRLGAGRFILSTPRVLENLDAHPAADRLLLNLVTFAGGLGQRRA